MNKLYYLAFLSLVLLCSACNQHIYAPALFKTDISYQFKPMSSDSVKTANYVSGSVMVSQGANQQDEILIGQGSFNRAVTLENFNLSYGGYGFLGNYQNTTLSSKEPGYFTNKLISGLGLRSSADVYVATGRTNVRFGLEGAYSIEFGSYADFRRSAQTLPGFYTDASTSMFTGGFATEVIWHNKKNFATQYGYRLFIGSVFGNHTFLNNTYGQNNFDNEIYPERFCVSGAYILQVNRAQFVLESQNVVSLTFRFGYRF